MRVFLVSFRKLRRGSSTPKERCSPSSLCFFAMFSVCSIMAAQASAVVLESSAHVGSDVPDALLGDRACTGRYIPCLLFCTFTQCLEFLGIFLLDGCSFVDEVSSLCDEGLTHRHTAAYFFELVLQRREHNSGQKQGALFKRTGGANSPKDRSRTWWSSWRPGRNNFNVRSSRCRFLSDKI